VFRTDGDEIVHIVKHIVVTTLTWPRAARIRARIGNTISRWELGPEYPADGIG
jgi:hypothetical protein